MKLILIPSTFLHNGYSRVISDGNEGTTMTRKKKQQQKSRLSKNIKTKKFLKNSFSVMTRKKEGGRRKTIVIKKEEKRN